MSDDLIETNLKSLENSISDKKGLRPVILRMRTGARIAAVQLAYSVGITQSSVAEALPEFIDHYGEVIAGQLKVKKLMKNIFSIWQAVLRAKNSIWTLILPKIFQMVGVWNGLLCMSFRFCRLAFLS